jgi:hypothetical protein
MISFLQETFKYQQEQNTKITFGVHGSLYPFFSPETQGNIPDAVNMQFKEEQFNHRLTVLLSDYTVNSLLYMTQQTGYLTTRITNDTNNYFPYNLDTESVAANLFPEIRKKYYSYGNKNVEVKVEVGALDNNQPLLNTDTTNMTLSVNFLTTFFVQNSSLPWDDPNKELQLNITATTNFNLVSSEEGSLSVNFSGVTVDSADVLFDDILLNKTNLVPSLENTLNGILMKASSKFKDINVVELLNNFTGLTFRNLLVSEEKEFLTASIDLDL